jgi:hypothetical protein
MATSTHRAGTPGRKTAARPAAAPDSAPESQAQAGRDESRQEPPPAIDSTLDAWAAQFAREQLAWQIGISRAILRGAKAMREAQVQAAERAETACLKAGEQLLAARGVSEVGSLQLDLLRDGGEEGKRGLTALWQGGGVVSKIA